MSQHSSISTFCALRHGKYQPHTHRLGNPTKGLSSYSLSASPQTLRFSPITRLPTLRGDVSNSATGCHSTHWYGTCTLRLNPVPIRLLHPFDIWSVSFLALLEPDHDTSNYYLTLPLAFNIHNTYKMITRESQPCLNMGRGAYDTTGVPKPPPKPKRR